MMALFMAYELNDVSFVLGNCWGTNELNLMLYPFIEIKKNVQL